jgi:hypothetical protein
MSEAGVRAEVSDARQCMFRFWMAISAVWLTFWLLIGGIVLLIVEIPYVFSPELGSFALVVAAPPAALLLIGIAGSWASQSFADAFCTEKHRKQQAAPEA